jgi:hypothetical protein
MQIEPDDSTLYAKRSLCWVHMSEQDKALDDAYTYRTMKMDLSNSCYEQTAALILVKVSCGRVTLAFCFPYFVVFIGHALTCLSRSTPEHVQHSYRH